MNVPVCLTETHSTAPFYAEIFPINFFWALGYQVTLNSQYRLPASDVNSYLV